MRPALPLTLLLAIGAAAAGLAAQQPFSHADAERLLAECRSELAPDRRVRVFDVTVATVQGKAVLSGEVHDRAMRERLLARFAAHGEVETDELHALPAADVAERPFAVVSTSVANLRSAPGHAKELGTQALAGMPLRVLKQDDGWFYVQTPNDYLCWTNSRMQRMTPAEFNAWRALDKVVVTATFTEVRAAPEQHAARVADVVAGCVLALDAATDEDFAVHFPDGRKGFLSRSDAQPFAAWLRDAKDEPARLVATARRFVGVPYLWGGTSTKGMDCSGFVSTVWLLNGRLLPRDASQQVHCGVEVPIDERMSALQPGDLLFFGRHATGTSRERVTHVGISLGGHRFIHESTDVRENSFDPADPDFSQSLKDSLLRARRVVGAGPAAGVVPIAEHPLYLPR